MGNGNGNGKDKVGGRNDKNGKKGEGKNAGEKDDSKSGTDIGKTALLISEDTGLHPLFVGLPFSPPREDRLTNHLISASLRASHSKLSYL